MRRVLSVPPDNGGKRDLTVAKGLWDFGVREVPVQVGWKGITVPGWNAAKMDPSWSVGWKDADGKQRPGIEEWLTDFDGNVGVLSGRAPRMLAEHAPFEYVVTLDFDAGHVEGAWTAVPAEVRRTYDEALRVADESAVFYGRSVSGDGRTAVFVSSRAWASNAYAVVAGGRPLVQVFGVGTRGTGSQKLIPPSRVDPGLAPDDAERQRISRTQYETIRLDLSAERLASQEKALDSLAALLHLSLAGQAPAAPAYAQPEHQVEVEDADVLRILGKLPNGALHVATIAKHFGRKANPDDGHGSYEGVVALTSALVEAGAAPDQVVRILGYTGPWRKFWRDAAERLRVRGTVYHPLRRTLLSYPVYSDAVPPAVAPVPAPGPVALPPEDWVPIPPPLNPGMLWHEGEEGPVAVLGRHVEAVMDSATFATFVDSEEIRIYRDGYYAEYGERAIKEWVEDRFRAKNKTAGPAAATVVDGVRRRSYVKRSTFNPKGFLCLENCVLNLDTLKPLPHSPKLRFTAHSTVSYMEKATCPKFDAAYARLPFKEEKDRLLVQEFFGDVLVRGNRRKRTLVLVGAKDSGKSTLISTLVSVIGEANVAVVSLQDIAGHRFVIAQLFGKLLVEYADLPSEKGVFDPGRFKMLFGNDLLMGERKNEHPFHFTNEAKGLFSANRLPRVVGADDAFWTRWLVVQLVRSLTPEEMDPDILDGLAEEKSGILNWMIAGLVRLRERGHYDPSATMAEMSRRWVMDSDSAGIFIDEWVEEAKGGEVSRATLYSAFTTWCEAASVEKVPEAERFAGRLKEKFAGITSRKSGNDRLWVGVALKTPTAEVKTDASLDNYTEGDPTEPAQPALDGSLDAEKSGQVGQDGHVLHSRTGARENGPEGAVGGNGEKKGGSGGRVQEPLKDAQPARSRTAPPEGPGPAEESHLGTTKTDRTRAAWDPDRNDERPPASPPDPRVDAAVVKTYELLASYGSTGTSGDHILELLGESGFSGAESGAALGRIAGDGRILLQSGDIYVLKPGGAP